MASFWSLIFGSNRSAARPANAEGDEQSNVTLHTNGVSSGAKGASVAALDQPEPLDVTVRRLRHHLDPIENSEKMGESPTTASGSNSTPSSEQPHELSNMVATGSMADQSVSIERVLEPGAMFKGYIFIPGYEEREEYTLQVLPCSSSDLDELGTIVSHAAYGDEQVCVFRVVDSADGEQGTFKVTFSDAETFCEGTFSLHSLELKGSVSQVKDEPGFWLPKEEETHRFELRLQDEGDMSRAKRASDHAIAQELLEKAVVILRRMEENEETAEQVAALFHSVNWDTLWAHAVLQSEESACKIRATTDWLNQLRFFNEEEKREILANLPVPRTRAGCHQCIDEALVRVQMVLGFRIRSQYTKARGECDSSSLDILQVLQAVGQPAKDLMQKAQIQRQRLFNCYAAFDRALRSVEARPPQDFFEKRKCQSSQDFVCSICQVEVDGIEEVLGLDCGHSFHVECAMQWIHQHAQCPNCRGALYQNVGPNSE